MFSRSLLRLLASKERLTILYGSQTGTTAAFAQTVGTFAKSFNFDVNIKPIDDFDFQQLQKQKPHRTILLTSTCGTGEIPRNAERFAKWLDTCQVHVGILVA